MSSRVAQSAASLAIGFALAATVTVSIDASPQSRAGSVKERFEALSREYEAKRRAFYRALVDAKTDEQKQAAAKAAGPDDAAYAKQFLALAREEPSGTVAMDALSTTIQLGGHGPDAQAAIELMRRGFATAPKTRGFIQQIAISPCLEVEGLLRDVLAKNPDRTAQGLACQGLANLLDGYANLPRLQAQDPGMAARLERVVGKENLDRLARRDAAAMLQESEALHERVLAQYADVRLYPEVPTDAQTIGKASEIWLGARREMAVGHAAPAIEGEDVDGKPIKLSEYRGKVVVVVFWASWCAPCMDQVPHEKALAKRLQGKPFALLGVNCDYSKDEARAVIAREGITWPNVYDGDPSEGPMVARWHARSLPQIYVLGPDGVIRFKDVRGESLGKAVDELLAKMPKSN
jgi:thiol-disulfide isomerase/thioredoxin